MSKDEQDEGWVGPLYSSSDPSCATRLQVLLEDRGIPAMVQTRQWGTMPAVGLLVEAIPIVYQVLVSSADVQAHRAEVREALEEVRRELGVGSELTP